MWDLYQVGDPNSVVENIHCIVHVSPSSQYHRFIDSTSFFLCIFPLFKLILLIIDFTNYSESCSKASLHRWLKTLALKRSVVSVAPVCQRVPPVLMVLGYACATTFGRSGGRRDRFAKRTMEVKLNKVFHEPRKRHKISEKKTIRPWT